MVYESFPRLTKRTYRHTPQHRDNQIHTITWSIQNMAGLKNKMWLMFSIYGHSVHNSALNVVRNVINRSLLDAYENLSIIDGDNLTNNVKGPIPFSCLYML